MKNKLLLFLVMMSLLALPNLSFAVSTNLNSTTTERETIKDRIEAKKEAIEQNTASRTEEVKNTMTERNRNALGKIRDRLDNFVSNVLKRFNAAANRLDILTQRINSRITKMEARNVDVKEAKDLLVTAKAKIDEAKASIALITFSPVTGSASSTIASILKDAFAATKVQIEKAKQDLKAAHAALVDVINSLKPGDNKLKNESSSSATSTTATTTNED